MDFAPGEVIRVEGVARKEGDGYWSEPDLDADFVAARTGAKVLVLAPSVGALRGQKLDSYIDVLAYDIAQIAAAVK
jgi:hypothetical protein